MCSLSLKCKLPPWFTIHVVDGGDRAVKFGEVAQKIFKIEFQMQTRTTRNKSGEFGLIGWVNILGLRIQGMLLLEGLGLGGLGFCNIPHDSGLFYFHFIMLQYCNVPLIRDSSIFHFMLQYLHATFLQFYMCCTCIHAAPIKLGNGVKLSLSLKYTLSTRRAVLLVIEVSIVNGSEPSSFLCHTIAPRSEMYCFKETIENYVGKRKK